MPVCSHLPASVSLYAYPCVRPSACFSLRVCPSVCVPIRVCLPAWQCVPASLWVHVCMYVPLWSLPPSLLLMLTLTGSPFVGKSCLKDGLQIQALQELRYIWSQEHWGNLFSIPVCNSKHLFFCSQDCSRHRALSSSFKADSNPLHVPHSRVQDERSGKPEHRLLVPGKLFILPTFCCPKSSATSRKQENVLHCCALHGHRAEGGSKRLRINQSPIHHILSIVKIWKYLPRSQ